MTPHRARASSPSQRRRSPHVLVLVLALGLFAAACSTSVNLDEPPGLNVGRDICARCGMIIEDVRFAAGFRLEDGTSRVFDDIGGMLAWGKLSGELEGARVWVHDYHSESWVDATTATFVLSSDIPTPMAFGIAAFSTREAAEAFAQELDAMVHSWDDVSAMGEAGELEDHHGEGAEGANADHATHASESEVEHAHTDS